MPHRTSPRQVMTLTLIAAPLLFACGGRSTTATSTTATSTTARSSSDSNATTVATTPTATTAPSISSISSISSTVAVTQPPGTTAPLATTTGSSATTVDAAAAKAQITTNWERFFLPSTSLADRAALLENGAALQAALEQRAKDPLQQQASAKVKAIDLTAPDRATVTYDVSLNGTVALPDAQGVAVLQQGVWKVSADSFCALISLGATDPIPGCS
jgi:hypothetical protein